MPLFSGTVGVGYSQTFQATGGTQPYSWSITSGSASPLTLNSSTGSLTGTPTTQGTLTFSVQVKDSGSPQQTASGQFSITVDDPPLVIFRFQPPVRQHRGPVFATSLRQRRACSLYLEHRKRSGSRTLDRSIHRSSVRAANHGRNLFSKDSSDRRRFQSAALRQPHIFVYREPGRAHHYHAVAAYSRHGRRSVLPITRRVGRSPSLFMVCPRPPLRP